MQRGSRRYRNTTRGQEVYEQGKRTRRARQMGAVVIEPVDRLAIFRLDNGICYLCDLPVDPQAFDLDHIIPLAVEPIEAAFNYAVTHPACNRRKRTRFMVLSPAAQARWVQRRPADLIRLAALADTLANPTPTPVTSDRCRR
jgi:hypothetical protein